MSISKNNYLPALTSLRFFAALLVIIAHAQQSVGVLGITKTTAPILDRGRDGVEFFFVLSGFLITYLLCEEIARTGTVSIKKFYARRIFRIWPLYFILIFIGIIVLGYIYPFMFHKPYFDVPMWKWVTLFVLFLPNLATAFFKMGLLHPLWSIGVEEQFYLFWAPLVKFFKTSLYKLIICFIAISFVWQVLVDFHFIKFSPDWRDFFMMQKFYAMAVGSLFGYIFYYNKQKFQQSFFSNKFFQIILIVAVALHLCCKVYVEPSFLFHFLLAFVFGLIIINTACTNTTIFKLDKRPFVYLGTISYGLYMYHKVVDFALRTAFTNIHVHIHPCIAAITYHILLLLLTIPVAAFSYKYIEAYFLKLKEKYAL